MTTYASERVRNYLRNPLFGVGFSQVGVVLVQSRSRAGIAYLAFVAAVVVLAWRRAGDVRVEAGDDGLTVVNPFRTHRVRWDEVEWFERRRVRWVAKVVCPVAVTARGRVTLLAMPVAVRERGKERPLKDSVVVARWESLVT